MQTYLQMETGDLLDRIEDWKPNLGCEPISVTQLRNAVLLVC